MRLFTYHDYMSRLEHEENRIIVFVVETLIPELRKYAKRKRFWLFSTRDANGYLGALDDLIIKSEHLIPKAGFLERVRLGGIQSAL